ncbi:MAG: hypothetical protein N3D17_06430 [bacterium]|nr:hypothetical protein [bacterium]
MVIEKVKEIKEAEDKAEEILKEAERKALTIRNSLSAQLERLRQEKEKFLEAEIKKYRSISESATTKKIAELEEEYRRKREEKSRQYQKNIIFVADSIWSEIKKDIML